MRIFEENTEITKDVYRIDTSVHTMTYVSGEFIYIASDFPFNHFFVKMGTTKNSVTTTMKIEAWDNSWKEVVELRDETSSLKNDGFVTFTPNYDNGWIREDSSVDIGMTAVVYYKYWIRISFALSLTASINISYIGNKFSDDIDLFSEYPVFDDSNFMTAFKSGKTSWEEQHVKACELIVQDLQKKNIILGKGQILDRNKFVGASVCKTAEIIFTAFGNDYVEQKKAALAEYVKRLDLSQYNVDNNGSGILEPKEIVNKSQWLSR